MKDNSGYKSAATRRKAQMIEQLGGEEAYKNYFRELARRSAQSPTRQKGVHKGGFSYMSKDKLKEVSSIGGTRAKEARMRQNESNNEA